ncbi:AMP-binding protein [Streptomyces sp. NBC_01102]|uniref:AMP-binding protein n=1 Tax=Streptomyces sp. NBC_01102 TaxID=2903749 RepID=UPI0038663AAA|nr:AMP-binding protein [Streptomyces sp. NBC_01102]
MTATMTCPIVIRFRDVAARHSGLTAIVGAQQRLSYAELGQQAEQWRRRCSGPGLPPGSPVVILCDGHPELPGAFLGVRAAGLVPVLIDAAQSASRVTAAIDAARPSAVIRLPGTEVEPVPGVEPRILPEGAGYVVFSSGSQGTPKGIIGLASGLLQFLDWEIETLGIRPGTRTGMLTSPSFDVVFRDLLLPLMAGGELHIAEADVRSRPDAVLPWIAEHAVSVVHLVPSLSARWISAAATRMPELRWTLFAGEPLYGQHVTRWRSAAPGTAVINLYGPSETTLAKFFHLVVDDPGHGLQPVGRPLPGTEVELEPVAAQDRTVRTHSITISTPHGSLGYLPGSCSADDELRLRRRDGITRFRTQDRGELDEHGDLVVTGRLDTLVKRNGTFVDIARIESAAVDLDGVRAACCFQLTPSGRIVLAVEGVEGPAAALRRRLQPVLGTELPDRILAFPSLPLLPSGKVDRRALRAVLDEGDEPTASSSRVPRAPLLRTAPEEH